MSALLQDVRFGLRLLRKNFVFTGVASIALALGIASSTAIFSIVDQVLLRPLPYPHSEQVLELSQTIRTTGAEWHNSSPANFLDWAAQNSVFSAMAATRGWQANLAGDENPERVRTTMASSRFFDVFGVSPLLGRTFSVEDAKPGNSQVVVLSHGLWSRRYGSDRSIINREIVLDGEKFTVIGVMPAEFLAPDEYGELWVPSPWDVPTHVLAPDQDPRQFRDRGYLSVWARLKSGVTLTKARSEMDAIAARLEHQYPDSNRDVGVSLRAMQEELVSSIRPVLLVLTAAVIFVLLIACGNVANLLLARASARGSEMCIRAAVGATRSRLIQQLLTESILLALLGGALGCMLASWAVPVLVALSPSEFHSFKIVALDQSVLAFTLIASIATGVIFGLAPALYTSRTNSIQSLHDGQRGGSSAHVGARGFLITAELAVSLILLVGAGLTLKSFANLTRVDPGFNPDRVLVFNVAQPSRADSSRALAFYHVVVERLSSLPGVKSAAAINRLPFSGGNSTRSFNVAGEDKTHEADIRVITPDYFQTLGIPLLKGRAFSDRDSANAPSVAIINAATAREVFGTQDAIGKFITKFGSDNQTLQIVGIVGDVRHVALERAPRTEIYQPLGQAHWPSMFIAIRSATADPRTLISAAQNTVWNVDKNVPLANVRTMQDMIAGSVVRRKFTMLLLAIFAGLAVLLAAIGLYGVLSYSVAQRTREIGIRVALGAQRRDVLRLILSQGMLFVGFGVVAGLVGSSALMRLISSMLFGVTPMDPATFAVVALLLCGIALIACWLPARRATRVDPVIALRSE